MAMLLIDNLHIWKSPVNVIQLFHASMFHFLFASDCNEL